MLMPGTATTDTDIVATDGEVTTGLTATTVTTERGLQMLNLQLSQLLLLILTLTLMRGTDTTDTVAMDDEERPRRRVRLARRPHRRSRLLVLHPGLLRLRGPH